MVSVEQGPKAYSSLIRGFYIHVHYSLHDKSEKKKYDLNLKTVERVRVFGF